MRITMRRIALILAAMALMAVAAAPAAAATDYYHNLGVGTPTLSKSRVVVTVPVQITCDPLDPQFTLVGQAIIVDVVEAVDKKTIAHGEGSIYGGSWSNLIFACDGTPHTILVSVWADPTGAPFTKGWMSVSFRAELTLGYWSGDPSCLACGSILVDYFTSFGPVDRQVK